MHVSMACMSVAQLVAGYTSALTCAACIGMGTHYPHRTCKLATL